MRSPWLRLKLAASLDGRTALAGGESRWITGEAARADVQSLRAQCDAVMTGLGTVVADDPRLDVRMATTARQPLRVVLDTHLRTPPSARIISPPGQLLILTASDDARRMAVLMRAGASVEVLPAGESGLDLSAAMSRLATLGIQKVHVECGPTLAGALLTARLVDEIVLYLAPSLLGDDARPLVRVPPIPSLNDRIQFSIEDLRLLGQDLRVTLRPMQA
jgi:diaminohydroxyphosphoribosylaminopyrimidine deaminase/5-amino-6-(5-phosphoribosylamino)uracil reductase